MELVGRFHDIVDAQPEAVAVLTEDDACSYAHLDMLANAFAHQVLQAPFAPVAIPADNDLAGIAAVLGVLKAGRPYCVVAPGDVPEGLEPGLVLDLRTSPGQRTDRPRSRLRPDAPAGIFYTSGSTGRPKAVVRSHQAMLHRVQLDEERLGLGPGDRVSHLFQMGFGASVSDLFGALLKGATLCPAPDRLDRLAEWIRAMELSHLHLPVALFRELSLEELGFPTVRRLIPSGRLYWTDLDHYRRLFPRDCRLVSQYSCSEASCIAWMFIDHDTPSGKGPVPVGRPARDKELILTEQGEVVVRSRYLADGYWRNPTLTAEKFRPDGFHTGDLGRLDENGLLHLLGRRDDMVKLRGHRIELLAVDQALHQYEPLREAVTAVREDRLVAYVVPRTSPGPTASQLRNHLTATLPPPMVPSRFVELPRLPRNSNGKVDYQALPLPDAARPRLDVPFVPPKTELEKHVAAAWAEVLGVEQVGRHDSFLELGGDSLKGLRALSRLGYDLPLARLLENLTVEQVARELRDPAPAPPPNDELSSAQLGLWLAQQAAPGQPLFNEPRLLRVAGPLRLRRLEQALERLMDRHDVLRTRYPTVDGRPVPVVEARLKLTIRRLDFTAYAEHERESAATAACRLEAARPFRLDEAPMLRVLVCRLAPEDHLLLLVTHHIATDFQSREIFLRHLALAYRGEALPGSARYRDYVAREAPADPERDPPALELAPRRGRNRLQTSFYRFQLPWEALESRARGLQTTPFVIALAAFKALAHRYTGRDDIPVAAPFSQRSRPEWAELVGCLIAPAVITTDCSGNPTFAELAQKVRRSVLTARPSPRPQGIMFVVRPAGEQLLDLGDCRAQPVPLKLNCSRFELTFLLEEGGAASLEYRVDCWTASEVERLARHYRQLLDCALEDPRTRLDRLIEEDPPLVGPSPGLPSTGLKQLFEAQSPEALAIRHRERRVTYKELDALANGVAHHLLEQRPDWRDRPVAVKLPPGVEMIAAMLGVLKAGGAYLPLHPEAPRARNMHLLQQAEYLLERLPAAREDRPATNPGRDDLAYVLFTSGSTGIPRAVAVPQQAVLRLVHRPDYVELSAGTRVAHLAPLTFDAATFEIWGPLLNGGTVVIIDREEVLRPGGLRRALRDVDVAFVTTALFNTLVNQDPGTFENLETLLFGGEAADAKIVRKVLRHGSPKRLVHVYGPTEATTFTTAHPVEHLDEEATTVPIGRPIANTTVQVLDRHLKAMPHGRPGELCVGGPGLARGYLNAPEATERSFVMRGGVRLYRTGDRCVVDPDTRVVHFLGRTDDQVKLRGHRIEPGEVQAALAAHPRVEQCFVTVHEKRLVAYVVSRASEQSLRDHLQELLPEPMLPDLYVSLGSLPLSPNGKVDRRALPPPRPRPETGKPASALEQALAEGFAEILGLEAAGLDTHFFKAGGHSLLALDLLARLEREHGIGLPFSSLLAAPTVRQLAQLLESPPAAAQDDTPLVYLRRGLPDRLPLVCLHGFRGTLLHLFGLADRLDPRRPVIGLEHRSLDRPDVSQMAAGYTESLLAEVDGPYLLFGHCAAGTLALELANQLLARDREVPLVVLLDAVAPASRRPPRRWSQRALGAMIRLRRNPAETLSKAGGLRLRWLESWTRALLARRGFTVQMPVASRLDYVTQTTLKALLAHRPSRFPGRLALIRTEGMQGRDLGWSALCDEVQTFDIAGSHTDPFHDAHSVSELARILEDLVAEAEKRRPDEMS